MAQYIEINKIWSGIKYCCPACGKEVFTDEGVETQNPCEHVLFSYIDAVGEFHNPSSEIQNLIQQAEEDGDGNPCPWDEPFLDSLPENAVLFALTDHGMACGPVSTTVIHGIKFPLREDNDSD